MAVEELSSEVRAFEGRALRTGEGGRFGTEVVVVVVIVVTFPAFCFESVEVCRAYLSMFARFWLEERCEEAPSPVRDIAVDREPCCSCVRARGQSSAWSLTFDLSIVEPLLTGSFSSFTDKCSNRASSVLVAIVARCDAKTQVCARRYKALVEPEPTKLQQPKSRVCRRST